jgi:formylglycine-generating enzyme required for sulfatase activity
LAVGAYPATCGEPAPANAPFSPEEGKACQRAWAEHLGLPVQATSSLGMKLSLIPPGQFTMGSPQEEEWHRPDETLHRVTLTKAFYMGTTEVTQGQWKALMGKTPSFFTGDALPVETVTWEEAAEFCRKLSEKEGARYRLPSEAEWEHACRAGTTTPFHTGHTISTDQANYDGNHTYAGGPKGVFRETTTAAGSFAPNAWGVHDVHGNVWEWCADWYGEYPKGAARDPTGPARGEKRIVRGGCWINFPAVCRSANRGKVVPVSWNFHFGFRVVRAVD